MFYKDLKNKLKQLEIDHPKLDDDSEIFIDTEDNYTHPIYDIKCSPQGNLFLSVVD